MSYSPCAPVPCIPCIPPQFCPPVDFGNLFPSLIGPQGPPGGPGLYVNSLAELRLLDATVWPAGYQAVVGGYATVNDGGGGVFVYSPTGADADNDGTIVAPNNGIGRWYRNYSGAVNARWFGAVGDGATNDQPALQAAIDYVESLPNGGAIYVPGAVYLIELALTISGLKSLFFLGDGFDATTIKTSGVINAFEMGSGAADRTVDLRLSNFTVDCDNEGEIGIVVNRLHQMLIHRVKVTGTDVGAIDLNMAYDNLISECLIISNNARGIIIDENNENTRIVNCRFELNTGVAVHFRNGSCSGSKVQTSQFIANGVGIQIDAGTVENAESFGIIGNYFKDQVSENCLFGTDASAFFIDSLLFQNNEVKLGATSAAVNTVEFDLCRKPVLMSNTFNDANVVTTANVVDLVELGNTYNTSAEPTEVQLGNADGILATLPTADPADGTLWSDAGIVTVS